MPKAYIVTLIVNFRSGEARGLRSEIRLQRFVSKVAFVGGREKYVSRTTSSRGF